MADKIRYKCPKCSNSIEILVNLAEPPVCQNNHLRGGVTMQKVEE